jgi:pSer/pThr/pTyr-binding forkhead associated (FHA) protein
LAEIVFSERSVSRLHARVCETAPGLFQIFDEGSTSGTWVNFTQVAQEVGRELHPGDLINLGRVQLRFQMRAAPGRSRSAGQPKGKFTPAQKTQRSVPDDTEPYRPVKP